MFTHVELKGELLVSATKFDRPLPPEMVPQAIRLGMLWPLFRTENLILDTGLDAFAAQAGGGVNNPTVGGTPVTPGTVGDLRVFEMRVTAQVAPAAPDETDTALEGTSLWVGNVDGPPIVDALLTVTYPATGQVRFSLVVPQTELVGTTFTEEGIFSKNGKLIARTTFSRPHPGTFGLQFDHTLSYVRP